MNLYAVQALLARVYWEMGDLEKAKDYALSVINCGFFKLEEKTDVEDMHEWSYLEQGDNMGNLFRGISNFYSTYHVCVGRRLQFEC